MVKKLDELQNHVRAMLQQCDEAETQLQQNGEVSRALLERTNSLREERFVTHWTFNDRHKS